MWTWLHHVFLTVCRAHVHTDVVSAYTNIFANDHFAGLRTGLSSYAQIYPNWLLSSLTSNYKQGKKTSGVRLGWVFAGLNFMFESRRVVCVADDAPNLERTQWAELETSGFQESFFTLSYRSATLIFLGSLRNCASLHWTAAELVRI